MKRRYAYTAQLKASRDYTFGFVEAASIAEACIEAALAAIKKHAISVDKFDRVVAVEESDEETN